MESSFGRESHLHDSTAPNAQQVSGGRTHVGRFLLRLFRIVMLLAIVPILYCLASSDLLGLLVTQHQRVDCVVFSPDANHIAARLSSRRDLVAGWNQTRREVELFSLGEDSEQRHVTSYSMYLPGHADGGSGALDFSPDGTTLAVACDSNRGGVRLWDLHGNGLRRIDTCSGRCFAVVFLAAQRTLAVAGSDGVTVHSFADGRHSRIAGFGWYHALATSPDGTTLVVGQGTVADVWSLSPTRFLCRLGPSGSSLSISPDGKTLATVTPTSGSLLAGGAFHVFLFDLQRGKVTAVYPTGANTSVSFSRDGRLAVASGAQVKLTDPADIMPTRILKNPGVTLTSVAFSPDGRLLAAGGQGRTITVWDVKTGVPAYRLGFPERWYGTYLSLTALAGWVVWLCWRRVCSFGVRCKRRLESWRRSLGVPPLGHGRSG